MVAPPSGTCSASSGRCTNGRTRRKTMTEINRITRVRREDNFDDVEVVVSAVRHVYEIRAGRAYYLDLPTMSEYDAHKEFEVLGEVGGQEDYVDRTSGFHVMRGWVEVDDMRFYYVIPYDVLYEKLVKAH